MEKEPVKQLETRNIKDLTPYDKNPRKNKEAVDKVLESLNRHGQVKPIVLSAKGKPFEQEVIVAGHTTMQALKRFGAKEAFVVVKEFADEAQFVDYNIRDNKSGEFAEWDEKLLAELSSEFEVDLGEMGFDFELDEPTEGNTDEDAVPEVPEEPTSKLGQIWKLGEHRLMCGDSTDKANVEALMDGEKADMVFTDPPYNVAFNGRSGKHEVIMNDDLSDDDFGNFITKTISMIKSIDAPIHYVWCNWKFYGILQGKLEYKSCIVWAKNVFGLGRGYRHQHEFCLYNGKMDDGINNESDLWEIKKDHNYVHPTQKPVELSTRALGNHKEAKFILDLFGGSGSTLLGCEKMKRSARIMELDPKYCDVIIKRWEDFTGNKSELIKCS